MFDYDAERVSHLLYSVLPTSLPPKTRSHSPRPNCHFKRFAGLELGAGVGKIDVLEPCDGNTNGDAAQDEYKPIRESVV